MLISERIEDRINKAASDKLSVPLDVVEKLNDFQWRIVLEATGLYNNIEITGLARLKTKDKVVINNINNKLDKIEREEERMTFCDDKGIERKNKKIEAYKEDIKFLRSKLKSNEI